MASRVRAHEAGRTGILTGSLQQPARANALRPIAAGGLSLAAGWLTLAAGWLSLAASCSAEHTGDTSSGPDAADLAARLLAECHGELSGFERFSAKVTLPDGGTAHVLGALPQRLRVQWPDATIDLLDGGRGARLSAGTATRTPLDAEALARIEAMRDLLDVAGLGPVRRAVRCEEVGPRTYQLHLPDGSDLPLVLQPDALRVRQLGRVGVHLHLDTQASHVIRIAELEPLGRCTIRFDRIDFAWDESLFEAQRETPSTTEAQPRPAAVTMGAPRRPAVPTFEPVRAQRWLCVDDPEPDEAGDWAARSRVVMELVATLEQHGQVTAGFQGLARDGERRLLVIPFRPAEGKGELRAPADWDVREVPAGRALAVYPPEGDFDHRRAVGEQQLRDALRAQSLQPSGLVLAQPFLHLDENAPDAAALAAPVVRVAVIVR